LKSKLSKINPNIMPSGEKGFFNEIVKDIAAKANTLPQLEIYTKPPLP
jgi:hypothetical protein